MSSTKDTTHKVSVVIPVFNGERTLRDCLESVTNQSYPDYEIIVINNNSSDGTAKIIKEFEESSKIRSFFEEKRTRGAARRKGELHARGEIILMTDADCVVPKNWVQEMIEPIATGEAVAVQGLMKPARLNYWTEQMQKAFQNHVSSRVHGTKADFLDTANCAIKTSVLKDIGYSDPEMWTGNDLDLHIRLKKKGYAVYFKPFAVVHYHEDTALTLFKKFFSRAIWRERIRAKYDYCEKLVPRKSIRPKTRAPNNMRFHLVQFSATHLGRMYAKARRLFSRR